jgi:hypothetical protein
VRRALVERVVVAASWRWQCVDRQSRVCGKVASRLSKVRLFAFAFSVHVHSSSTHILVDEISCLMQLFSTHIRSALRQIRKTGDVIYDDNNVFNDLSASRLVPRPPNACRPELVQFIERSQAFCTGSLTYPSITSLLRLSPPLLQSQGRVPNSADFFGGVENYIFALDVR